MGDRMQRIEGKAKEIKGATKRQAASASKDRGAQARGAAEELAGKTKGAAGKARSELRKATR